MIALLSALPLLSASLLPLPAQDGDVPPIQDTGDSYILNFSQSEEGMTLERFVGACQESTGRNFTYTQDTASTLRGARIRLYGTKEIPKEDFYKFFQIMMIINDFVCTKIGPDHLEVIMIQSLQTAARTNLRQDALFVLPENLQEFADQPATLIHTVLNLPNTDVRTLTNSMRAMLTDANTQQIIPVGNSNSLILTGFGSQVAALARMLLLVDEASKAEDPIVPEFEVIPLEFAAADEIADTIEELLEAGRRAAGQGGRQPQTQGVTSPIQRGQSETRIMVDPRTNSLLVMAMPEDMPQIKELVASLDVDVVERERNYHIYSLDNVDAEELADVLEDFLRDAGRVTQGAVAGQQNQQTQRQNEVVVVPDPGTNSILIAANRTRYEEVLDLIRRLDRRQDQVLIETALIELSGQDTLDIGVEFGLADIPQVGQNGGFGVTNFGLSQFSDTDGDGIPDARIPNNSTGISAGFLDGDDFSIPLILAALQTRRNTNVLNIPSILVNNNSSATIRSLDEQPTTQITTGGGVNGQTQENFRDFEEAGITLQISPTISASRYLRLNVFLEVSNFLGTFQGSIPPPRITRTIDTVINVPDGDTMVIGGIIVDDANKTRNSVPWLGDLPILGYLFRRDTDTKDRTTLYFFVTPHIMRDTEFADLKEYTYKKKTEAADAIGVGRVRIVDPDFGLAEDELDLSEFDVPLYQSPPTGEVASSEVGIDNNEVNKLLSDN